MPRGHIRRRESGNYSIRYFDPSGRRHHATAGSRREAERLLTQRSELHNGNWQPESQETLADYAQRWLQRRDPDLQPSRAEGRYSRTRLSHATHREYRRSLELHVLPTLGRRPLGDLRPVDVDRLIARLEDEGRAPGTIRNTIAPLRKLLGDAHRQGLIPANPAARPDLPPQQEFVGKELPREHTQAIRTALIDLAPNDPFQPAEKNMFWVCYFDLALATGLRQGELRALTWNDIDYQRKLIRIDKAYSRDILKRPKTKAGIRSVPIFPSTNNALTTLATRANTLGIDQPDQLIFQTDTGRPLHPSNVNRRVWQPALRHAQLANQDGKPVYRFHDLRHTCISRLVAAGADIKLIQAIAGHANPLITLNRYSHLLDHRLTEAATRYDPSD